MNQPTSRLPRVPYALLREVSRSFYLTLRVLPGAVRPQIGLAYALARATDSVADTDAVPVDERLSALDRLRARIMGESSAPLELARFLEASVRTLHPLGQGAPALDAERELLAHIEELLAALASFDAADQARIRDVLNIITSGQQLDLRRFGVHTPSTASQARVKALETSEELDDYTYRVAGCVGEFWTKMCRARLFPELPIDDAALLAGGVRFGKGLQLVNILRDLPVDLRHGRCYVPAQELAPAGLDPEALLDPGSMPRFRSLYDGCLDRAQSFLTDGWAYTNSLPRRQARVRLACAWPILIGVRTIAHLRAANVLDPGRRVKASRGEVRRLLAGSVLLCYWPAAWNWLFKKAGTATSSPIH